VPLLSRPAPCCDRLLLCHAPREHQGLRARERKVAELRTLRVLFLFSAKRESRSEKEERKVRLSERLDRASGSTQTFSPGGLGSLSSERLFSINLLSARPESDGPAHRPPKGQAERTRAPRAHRVSRGRKEERREGREKREEEGENRNDRCPSTSSSPPSLKKKKRELQRPRQLRQDHRHRRPHRRRHLRRRPHARLPDQVAPPRTHGDQPQPLGRRRAEDAAALLAKLLRKDRRARLGRRRFRRGATARLRARAEEVTGRGAAGRGAAAGAGEQAGRQGCAGAGGGREGARARGGSRRREGGARGRAGGERRGRARLLPLSSGLFPGLRPPLEGCWDLSAAEGGREGGVRLAGGGDGDCGARWQKLRKGG